MQTEIAKANGLTESDYTAETFNNVKTAVTSAEAINTKTTATQSEVDQALSDLQTAEGKLVKNS